MQEIELKFLVPESRLKGLIRQAKVKSSQVTRLAAHYYDTPDQKLAKAGIGLRIRQEGDTWVQTIKAGGDGIAARLEHNSVLDNEHVQAMLDNNTLMPNLSIYKDTSIAPALADFKLKKLTKNLTRQYVTDVQRISRLLTEDASEGISNNIELAYDHGEVIHGQDDTQREAIQEIEFELVSGDLDFLFKTASNWCKRYKLCLSTVTKAERGGLLITGQNHSPAVSANLNALNINKDSSMPAFIRAAVHNCLLQILPNSSAIVAGSTDSEHILQLYIGINRLRAALKAFDSFSDELNPEWQTILKQTANLLADYHKLSHLVNCVEPKLRQSRAPIVDWSTDWKAINIKPIDIINANEFQLNLLELIAFTMSDPNLEAQADKLAGDRLTKTLAKQYKKLLKVEDLIDKESDSTVDNTGIAGTIKDSICSQHNNQQAPYNLYQQLKGLRYISEFTAPLYGKKKTKRWLKQIIRAQKALEHQLDIIYYQCSYQNKASIEPNALYGAGWLNASLIQSEKRSEKRLRKLQSCATFWQILTINLITLHSHKQLIKKTAKFVIAVFFEGIISTLIAIE